MYEEQQNNPSRFVEMKYKNENNKKKKRKKKRKGHQPLCAWKVTAIIMMMAIVWWGPAAPEWHGKRGHWP
jgi:hypothetical protein